jgi:uncharacterized protein
MDNLWLGLILGASSFAHCLGMCGPLSLHLSRATKGRLLPGQLAWHGGRVFTYVFLGALCGFAGQTAAGLMQRPILLQAMAVLAGGVMVVMGLKRIGVFGRGIAPRGEGLLTATLRRFFDQPQSSGSFVLGLVTGFLPCGVVYAGLAMAVQSGSVLAGMGTMGAMGVGTVWALVLLAVGGPWINRMRGRWAMTAAGAILIVAGLATAVRGTTLPCQVLPHGQAGPVAPCCHGAATAPASADPSRLEGPP